MMDSDSDYSVESSSEDNADLELSIVDDLAESDLSKCQTNVSSESVVDDQQSVISQPTQQTETMQPTLCSVTHPQLLQSRPTLCMATTTSWQWCFE